ncbi:unnamed protein product [Vitrella brassicaformis CCMP3155]|uniref:Protein kinase domain-containing protein n=1 Tax=Vitrella brassicaformis (strain CCMP3155) TaxID=1169540 RepID=A0A0G4EFJ6_VITBC|nr:unnamed protein product [Vitrella brassicaformis CCMP3155]|eukprot:CEL94276.1 unnamed protein product [Vitrella brassicaformis CCMP3155]
MDQSLCPALEEEARQANTLSLHVWDNRVVMADVVGRMPTVTFAEVSAPVDALQMANDSSDDRQRREDRHKFAVLTYSASFDLCIKSRVISVDDSRDNLWLISNAGLKLEYSIDPRAGRFGTAVPMRDADGRLWTVKLLSHDETDGNARPVNGWYRSGNDLWLNECRRRAEQPDGLQPPDGMDRLQAVHHIPLPYATREGDRVEGITAYQMEWIDMSLHELRGPLPESALMRIGEGVVRAVDYLGRRGLMHGDIHASNIGIRRRQAPNPSSSSSSSSSRAAGKEYEAVLLDMDRLHNAYGDHVLSLPDNATDAPPNAPRQRPGVLSHKRDMHDAVTCVIESLRRLGAPQRLIDVFEHALPASEIRPTLCTYRVVSGLRELERKAAKSADENRRTPPLSPPSMRLPRHLTPQLLDGSPAARHRQRQQPF